MIWLKSKNCLSFCFIFKSMYYHHSGGCTMCTSFLQYICRGGAPIPGSNLLYLQSVILCNISDLDNHDVGVLRWIVLYWMKKKWSSGYPEYHCGQDLSLKYRKTITIPGSSGRPRRISISAPLVFSITSGLQDKSSPPVVT